MSNNVTFKFESEEDKNNFLVWFMDCDGDHVLSMCLEEQGKPSLYVVKSTGYSMHQRDLEAVIEMSSEIDE